MHHATRRTPSRGSTPRVYADTTLGRDKHRFGGSVAVRQDGDGLLSGSTTPVATGDD
jgi:hypothetical protein